LPSYLHYCFSFQSCHQALKNELVTKTDFAQTNGKSRTVLAKEIVFVIAGQFSRGKETREHECYHKTTAMLSGKRLGQSPSRKYRSSTKSKALFSLDCFFAFVSTSIGTKKKRIFIRGAPF